MAGKKTKAKKKGAVKAVPLATQSITIVMTVAKRYGHRINPLFEEMVEVLVDRIAGSRIEAKISKLKKGR